MTGGRGLSLDPIADHSIEQEDIDGNHIHVHTQRSTFGEVIVLFLVIVQLHVHAHL